MKKKFLLLPLMMLVLSSCSLFENPTSSDPIATEPTATDSVSNNPSDEDNGDEYTVSFDLNYQGAIGTPQPQVIKKYGLVTKPTDPIRVDHTFIHWHEGINGTIAWDFANTGVTANMTLYASWRYDYVEPEPTPKTFYVRAPSYWLADSHVVALHAWIEGADENNHAWPGERMSHVDGQIYSYAVEAKFTHMVFARVDANGEEPTDGTKAQTINLDITSVADPDFDFYWINDDVRYGDNKCTGRWSVYPNEPDDITPNPVTKTFYVRAPSYWLEDRHTVALYAYDEATEENNLSWPGDRMSHIDGQIYSYAVDEKFTHIIFARVTATGEEPVVEGKAQTINLDITNLSNPDFDFYWINDDVRYGDNKCTGRWSVYPNEPDEITPGPGNLYYVEIPTWWTSDGAVAGIYMWDDDENRPADWPGQLMGNVHNRIYSFLIPDEYSNFIFVRVNPNLSEWATADDRGDWGAKTIDLSKDIAGVHNLFTIYEEPMTWGDPGCQGVWSTYTG